MTALEASWQFSNAITRCPASSVVNALRSVDAGEPDYELLLEHHADYVTVLRSAGLAVTELEALMEFPDALFVEDTALCLPQGAILMKPFAPSRFGEVSFIEPILRQFFDDVRTIQGHGSIEAGDILTTCREVLVGRSTRTHKSAVKELRRILECWGHSLREVEVPKGVLHFKTDCSLLNTNTILSTERLAATGIFKDYDVVLTCKGEEPAANAIRCNDQVIMAAGFVKTAKKLRELGYSVIEVANSECAKIDGGMSCLSLRF